jgi:hypothetical protein
MRATPRFELALRPVAVAHVAPQFSLDGRRSALKATGYLPNRLSALDAYQDFLPLGQV